MNIEPWTIAQEAHLGVFRVFKLTISGEISDGIVDTYTKNETNIVRLLRSILETQGGSRIQIKYVVDLEKENNDEVRHNVYLDGLFHVMLHPSAIQEILISSISNIIEQLNIFNNNGSGWTLK